jgi:FKBP-type peptidyl-prolyl cis-trans isomerase
LEEFSYTTYELDSTEYGFYFTKNIYTIDSIESGTSADVRYVGKYLDGTVFDTNVADTAKKYRIYSSSNEYSALSFKYQDSEEETLSSNSFVEGFTKALWRMGYGDHGVAYFYSSLGYGDNGNSSIPGFVPLFFELWIEEHE